MPTLAVTLLFCLNCSIICACIREGLLSPLHYNSMCAHFSILCAGKVKPLCFVLFYYFKLERLTWDKILILLLSCYGTPYRLIKVDWISLFLIRKNEGFSEFHNVYKPPCRVHERWKIRHVLWGLPSRVNRLSPCSSFLYFFFPWLSPFFPGVLLENTVDAQRVLFLQGLNNVSVFLRAHMVHGHESF